MLTNFFNWTKNNKVTTVIIFLLALIVIFKDTRVIPYMLKSQNYGTDMMYQQGGVYPEGFGGGSPISSGTPMMLDAKGLYPAPYINPIVPITNTPDRKVITEASLSLQVKNVTATISTVKTKLTEIGGYLVNSNTTKPEFGDSATLSVRVPAEQVEPFLAFAKTQAVKVINENITGADITDQFVDLETRLTQLNEQKAKLEAILQSAKTVEDIMSVQPYINQVQSEIDAVKGQTGYIDGASKYSLITMYLSTDELSLPYTPEKSWRPQVIYKNAMRSLLVHAQLAGTALIWLGVYSMVLVPAFTVLLVIYLVARRKKN